MNRTEFDSWYSKVYVLLECVKTVGRREVALLPYKEQLEGFKKGYAVRNLHCMKLDFMSKSLAAFKFNEQGYRMYTSLAHFNQFPNLSYAFVLRKKEQKIWTKELASNPSKYIEGMDFLIDLDCADFDAGLRQIKGICEIMDNYKVPYFVMPSGGKAGGWHVRIEWKWFEQAGYKWNQISNLNFLICHKLKTQLPYPDVDESLFDLRRVGKMPYSLVYAQDRWNVCLPLSPADLANYKQGNNEVNYVLSNCRLMNRGLLERTGTINGLRNFVKEYAVKPI